MSPTVSWLMVAPVGHLCLLWAILCAALAEVTAEVESPQNLRFSTLTFSHNTPLRGQTDSRLVSDCTLLVTLLYNREETSVLWSTPYLWRVSVGI